MTAQRDASQETLEQVEKAADSEPVKGEERLESDDLKRRFREEKKRRPTKLVFSHRVGKRSWADGWSFVRDVGTLINGAVQIATDQLPAYVGAYSQALWI